MKHVFRLIVFACPVVCFGQSVKSFDHLANTVNVHLSDGTLSITPLTDNAVRIKFYRNISDSLNELVLIDKPDEVKYQVTETPSGITLRFVDDTVVFEITRPLDQ